MAEKSTLYLLKYNNYYNRIVKKYDTVTEYITAEDVSVLGSFTGLNFNPNDGVHAEHVLNYNGADMPDYLLVTDEEGNIISRWYILENVRTRGLQFRIELYRDLIADFYDNVIEAPCFIEKAMLSLNDNGIFNNEDLTFNQIKTSEKLIKDDTNAAWYVGYVAKDTPNISVTITTETGKISNEYTDFGSYPYNTYNETPLISPGRDFTFKAYYYGSLRGGYQQGWDKDGNPKTPKLGNATEVSGNQAGVVKSTTKEGYQWVFGSTEVGVGYNYIKLLQESEADWEDNVRSITNTGTQTEVDNFISEKGKIYKIGDKYYEIDYISSEKQYDKSFDANVSYAQKYVQLASENEKLTTTVEGNIGGLEYTATEYYLVYKEVAAESITFTFTQDRVHTSDAPYDVFALPATSGVLLGTESATQAPPDVDLSKRIVDALIIKLGDNLYDIQLLPYCPIQSKHVLNYNGVSDSVINTDTFLTEDGKTHYELIKGENSSLPTFILYLETSTVSKTVMDNISAPGDSVEFKVSNECDLYRLVSPNYNGQFEFSLTKNGGVRGWNIALTCKPFSPYIKVSPTFGRLYGQDFKDARGLICGGDFSLSQISDAWVNYEISNKNYQVMFDRQIQNLELNNSVQRTRERIAAITGTVQGATSGAMLGMMTGSPVAAVAGGAGAGVTSGIAGMYDLMLNENLRREALDFSRDQFGYQLQNIQALPYSLTKVGAQNEDYKLWPFLEYYTCSEVEKQALRDKITYNGMTVMRIGTVQEFIQPQRSYIKAKLIRLESIADDYHIVNQISRELNEGVYI